MNTTKEAVITLYKDYLMRRGVVGFSIVQGSTRVRLYVESEEHATQIPATIASYPVEVIVVGKVRILSALPTTAVGRALAGETAPKTAKWRPAPGGVSVGHPLVTAGTLGSRVYDRTTLQRLILSNNHVICASNRGRRGDPVYQPGVYDGGSEKDTIARLLRCVRVTESGNLVDTAVAKPVRDEDLSDEILDIGVVTESAEARVGMKVAKSGRTTCYTENEVIDTNATIKVDGYPWGASVFEDQIVIKQPYAKGGDSGSIVVDRDTKRAVGLLFAASDMIAVANKIGHVERLINISFSPTPTPFPTPSISPSFILLPVIGGVILAWVSRPKQLEI